MPLRVRAWILGVGIAAILPLLILLFYAPPDGGQRAELAQLREQYERATDLSEIDAAQEPDDERRR